MVPERDEHGKRLRTRVSSTLWADNYNWVNQKGGEFDAIFDAAIEEKRRKAAEKFREITEDPAILRLKEWIAEMWRSHNHGPTLEELAAKKKELGLGP